LKARRFPHSFTKHISMDVSESQTNGWRVFAVEHDLGLRSDMRQLKNLVLSCVEEGVRYVALCFTPDSFFNTQAISMCVQCAEMVQEKGGILAFIKPNRQIADVLEITDLASLVTVYPSIESLPPA